jgi:hypothetical protein
MHQHHHTLDDTLAIDEPNRNRVPDMAEEGADEESERRMPCNTPERIAKSSASSDKVRNSIS